jgi:CRP-like cAMP-binding protein
MNPDFLGQLAPIDRATIEPHLEAMAVARGSPLFRAADAGEHIYFPQGPLISIEQTNRVEVALIGSEGLVGWPALVGCKCSPYHAIVRGRDGIVLRIGTSTLLAIASFTPSLALVISRFVNVVSVQMAETIGACAFHRIDMRIARWLLLRHDRLGSDEIAVNHDEIADNLGTRRASITDCLHIIEGNGLVRCRRGRITIRDRAGLEALATGCYGAAESFYREIIGASDEPVAVAALMKW